MAGEGGLTAEQKNFLQGFAMGADVARAVKGLPVLAASADPRGTMLTLAPRGAAVDGALVRTGEERAFEAQNDVLAAGRALSREEGAKRAKDPLNMYDEIQANARAQVFPKDTDVFLYKFSGLFFVAPAQNAFMCRLRIPGGVLRSWQFRGVAELARTFASGHVDVTTRANLQIREIRAAHAPAILNGLMELGIVTRGSGADNIRNVTANPTSGIDPQEWIETLPLAREMHHFILNHRDMYTLPRKFNIAFDGGGKVGSLDDTNDIGFHAVRISDWPDGAGAVPDVGFRLRLGGITGHHDFARDTEVVVPPEECVAVAAAIVRVFIRSGDRTDRKKARLKYVLDAWGHERFLSEVEREYGRKLARVPRESCRFPDAEDRWGHVGVHAQKQAGLSYVGVVLPVGRMSAEQVEGLAALAERYGSGTIRLTVWQNLLISDIAREDVDAVKQGLERLGLDWDATSLRSGLVACTGSAGCKYAGADTKGNALALAKFLEERVVLDQPINIHVTGCHHSCAQHTIADIGLEATRVEVEESLVEGYHLHVGGGWETGAGQGIGRRVLESMPFTQIPTAVERLLRYYLDYRASHEQSFAAFAREQTDEALRAVVVEGRVMLDRAFQTS